MFKILFITLITSFISLESQAQSVENVTSDVERKYENINVCHGEAKEIWEKGIEPCARYDILIEKSVNTNSYERRDYMRLICRTGTIRDDYRECRLKDEEDFGKIIKHSED